MEHPQNASIALTVRPTTIRPTTAYARLTISVVYTCGNFSIAISIDLYRRYPFDSSSGTGLKNAKKHVFTNMNSSRGDSWYPHAS
jgi:hypothetical protein